MKHKYAIFVISQWLVACATPIMVRAHWLPFHVGVAFLAFCSIVAVGTAAFALLGRRRDGTWNPDLIWAMPLAAILLGVAIWAARFPWVHDVATNLDSPPRFSALEPADPPNTPVYSDSERRAIERRPARHLRPIKTSVDVNTALGHALFATRQLPSWHMTRYDFKNARIEGTTRDPISRLEIQIAVTARPGAKKAVVDARARSAVKGSDFGASARVLKAFYTSLGESWACSTGKARAKAAADAKAAKAKKRQ